MEEETRVDRAIRDFTAVLAILMEAAQNKALAPAEGCEHRIKMRWKKDKAVCVICRSILDENCEYGISLSGV